MKKPAEKSKRYKNMQQGAPNDFQTPPEELLDLAPYVPKHWVVYECAQGNGNLARGFHALGYQGFGTDLKTGHDFLTDAPPAPFDFICTNPPYDGYHMKERWVKRCLELGKPFALLLPYTVFGLKGFHPFLNLPNPSDAARPWAFEYILPHDRIAFETPHHEERLAEGKKSEPWFAAMWLTYGLNIGRPFTVHLEKRKARTWRPGENGKAPSWI